MIAAREGLLPWSRERQTAKLNVEAAELARSGDREKALWKLRRSLELNPNQPDAVRLREQLLGGIEIDWPHRSLMQDILHDGFDAGIEPLPPIAPMSRLDGSPTPTGPGASAGAPTIAGPTIPLTPSFTTAKVASTTTPTPAQAPAKPNARDALTRIKGAATASPWPWVGPIASPGQDLGPTP
jgi:hypothetical protein